MASPSAQAAAVASAPSPPRALVRPLCPETDSAALASVHTSARAGADRPLLTAAEFAILKAEWDNSVEARTKRWSEPRPEQITLVALAPLRDAAQPELVGFVSVSSKPEPDTSSSLDGALMGEILSVHVSEPAWGLGVGTALFAAALSELSAQGCSAAYLWVVRDNARARRFYEKMGLRPTGLQRIDQTRTVPLVEVQYRAEVSKQ